MTAIFFHCPQCEKPIGATRAVWLHNQLVLLADCESCRKEAIPFSGDALTATLFEADLAKGNNKVN